MGYEKTLHADGVLLYVVLVQGLRSYCSFMVGSIFSSDAWNNVTFIAGEIKNPKRISALVCF